LGHGGGGAVAGHDGERVALKHRGQGLLRPRQRGDEHWTRRCALRSWGLPDDTTAFYRNAMHVMLEAKATRIPDTMMSGIRLPAAA